MEEELYNSFNINLDLERVLKDTRDAQLAVQNNNELDQKEMLSQPDQRFQTNLSFVPTTRQG